MSFTILLIMYCFVKNVSKTIKWNIIFRSITNIYFVVPTLSIHHTYPIIFFFLVFDALFIGTFPCNLQFFSRIFFYRFDWRETNITLGWLISVENKKNSDSKLLLFVSIDYRNGKFTNYFSTILTRSQKTFF